MRASSRFGWILVGVAVVTAAAPAECLCAVVWLFPGLLTAMAERAPGRPLTRCLLLAGVAGSSPAFLAIWRAAPDLHTAALLAVSPPRLAAPWAAQAAAWLVTQCVGIAMSEVEKAAVAARVRTLEAARRRIMTEWAFDGDD